MNTRIAIAGGWLLAASCGPGPGGSSEGTETGGDTSTSTTTDGVTTSSTAGTGSGSGGSSAGTLTGATTGTSTTGATTTTASSGATTGAPSCAGIVGSEDCELLAEVSPDLSLEECQTCQGAPCGQTELCDVQYPCVDGSIVLRGCCTDDQCAGLTSYCGMFIGTNNICVLNDDV